MPCPETDFVILKLVFKWSPRSHQVITRHIVMASQIVAFLGTKKGNSRRSRTVNSRRDKKHISHYSTRIINLKEDYALTFKFGSDKV